VDIRSTGSVGRVASKVCGELGWKLSGPQFIADSLLAELFPDTNTALERLSGNQVIYPTSTTIFDSLASIYHPVSDDRTANRSGLISRNLSFSRGGKKIGSGNASRRIKLLS
jgi:hypothetical protein